MLPSPLLFSQRSHPPPLLTLQGATMDQVLHLFDTRLAPDGPGTYLLDVRLSGGSSKVPCMHHHISLSLSLSLSVLSLSVSVCTGDVVRHDYEMTPQQSQATAFRHRHSSELLCCTTRRKKSRARPKATLSSQTTMPPALGRSRYRGP